MANNEMEAGIEAFWPHPEKDANKDGKVSVGEQVLYVLKMIPYGILSILVPTLRWAIQDGIKEMFPIAVEFVRDIALSQIPGNQKADVVRAQLRDAAAAKGIELATRDINRLIENALACVEKEIE